MLMRRVLSGRYRITQEKFQYQGVEIWVLLLYDYSYYHLRKNYILFGVAYPHETKSCTFAHPKADEDSIYFEQSA